MNFVPTADQERALQAVAAMEVRCPDGGGVLVVSGPAGTGKTSLLRALADRKPEVVTPTGKAAVRVAEAAGLSAKTVHRWTYRPHVNHDTEEIEYVFNAEVESQAKLLVVDEASMVGASLWDSVYRTAVRLGMNVVLLGDGYQLKPVAPGEAPFSVFDPGFGPKARPATRVELREILRQDADSPIIRAATACRTGDQLDVVAALSELPTVAEADLVDEGYALFEANRGTTICWTNKTRMALNRGFRQRFLKAHELTPDLDQDPQPGEPLLVVKNNYVLDRYNGEVLNVDEVVRVLAEKTPVYSKKLATTVRLDFWEVAVGRGRAVICPQEVVGTLRPDWPALSLVRKTNTLARIHYPDREPLQRPTHLHANLGYVLTTHKAQGSEWDDVIVYIEEGQGVATMDERRLLYTALTRARLRTRLCWARGGQPQ